MAFQYNLDLIANARLAASLSDVATSMTVLAGQGAAFTQPPAIAVLANSISLSDLASAEHIRLDDRTSDVLTITRGIVGTPQAWPAGTYVFGFWSPEHFNNVYSFQNILETTLKYTIANGKSNVVFKRTDYDFDAVITTGMNFGVTPGSCFANSLLFAKDSQTDFTFTAPAVSDRIDLVQANAYTREITVKSGAEGGAAPTADTNCLALWEILLTSAHTDIILGDVTDKRVW